jgi:O-antigen ligase
MTSLKPSHWLAIVSAFSLALYFIYFHLPNFGNVSFLGAIIILEIVIAALWNFDQRFFVLLMITFLWGGMNIPLQGAAKMGRWIVLAAGALVGFVIWVKAPRGPFRTIHLLAFFCVFTALISATVSSFIQVASLKALSLGLLFLYCASGVRLALLNREERFFNGMILGCEMVAYGSTLFYLGMGNSVWGNPNSLGAVMSIGVFPFLLWGWLISDAPAMKIRRLVALLCCTYLVRFSLSRAAMIAVAVVTVTFCLTLHRYKLLVKIAVIVLFFVAIGGMLAPESLNTQLIDLKDAFLYKGHKEEGVLGSRRGPWSQSIASIKEHPWFGTGYGTSPTGLDPGLHVGTTSSFSEVEREHGSSYITVAEWLGLVGVLPFIALIGLTASQVWRVCALMNRTSEVRYYSIPLAMVVLAGFVHAGFEDWLFAVGSYLSVFFWTSAFLLSDILPDASMLSAGEPAPRILRTNWRPDFRGIIARR